MTAYELLEILKEVLKLDAYKQAYLRIDAKKGMLVSNAIITELLECL
mgnify:CR=1 FL=1